jgi:hypothetical protein
MTAFDTLLDEARESRIDVAFAAKHREPRDEQPPQHLALLCAKPRSARE